MATEARTARDRLDRIATILKRATRFWLPAGLLVVVGTTAGLGVAFTRPRIYKSETLILYREGIRSSDLGGPDVGGDPARKLGLKLKEMVLSRTQLQKIIDDFKLYPALVEDRGYVDAVDEMRNHIAFRVKDGDTFGLSFEGEDARRVQTVTAALADTLIHENSRSHAEQAEVTKEFLDTEKQRVEKELKDKETELAKFLAKHPEFAKETAQATNQAGTAIRAAAEKKTTKTADPTLLALEREATRIQERLGVPVAKKSKKDDGAAIDPKLAGEKQAAEQDVSAAQKDLADKAAQFTEQHPDVRAAKTRLKTAQDRLKRVNEAIQASLSSAPRQNDSSEEEGIIDRATLENELRKVNDEIAAYKRKKQSESQPNQAGGEAARVVALETDWTRLNREVTEARERNQQVQTKQFNASMAESAAASGRNAQMVIIDPAYKPTHPAKPSRSLIAAVGAAASLGLAFVLALGMALLDDRLYDRVDVERLEVIPLLGVVPRARPSKKKRGELRV